MEGLAKAARGWWAVPLLAVAFAYRHAVGQGLVQDADFLIASNHFLDGLGQLWPNLTHDYFWSSSGNRIPYWRPAVKGSWVLEVALFGRWPPGFHLVQLGWHLGATGGVMALGRALGGSRPVALGAGLLFGLHPAAIEPVCLVMARSDVMSAAAGIWSLWAWQRWRTTGAAKYAVVHAAALLLALGSKEAAVMLAPVVTLWALLRREPRAAAPAWIITALYLLARSLVLRDIAPVHGELSLVRVMVAGGRYLGGLFPFRITTGIHNIALAELPDLRNAIAGWGCLLAVAYLMVRTRRWTEVGLLGWMLAMLAPVLLVASIPVPGVQDKLALADRWLYPSAAAASLLAALIVGPALLVPLPIWLVVMLVRSGPDRAPYTSEASLLEAAEAQYQSTPDRLRTAEDRCLHEERLATGALERREPVLFSAPCQDRPASRVLELQALVGSGRYREALPRARELLARRDVEARYSAQVHYLVGQTFLETGEVRQGEDYLRRAAALGLASCNLPAQLGKAAALGGRLAEAAGDYEQAAACASRTGTPSARALIAAGHLWVGAGRRTEARRVVERLGALPLSPDERALYLQLRDAVIRP